MSRRRQPNAAELAKQLARLLAEQNDPAANDDEPANEPAIDERAIRERARRAAERMRKARAR